MLTRIKTKEAARQLSISEQAVKVQMQRGLLPIGTIMNNGGKYLRHLSGVAG